MPLLWGKEGWGIVLDIVLVNVSTNMPRPKAFSSPLLSLFSSAVQHASVGGISQPARAPHLVTYSNKRSILPGLVCGLPVVGLPVVELGLFHVLFISRPRWESRPGGMFFSWHGRQAVPDVLFGSNWLDIMFWKSAHVSVSKASQKAELRVSEGGGAFTRRKSESG